MNLLAVSVLISLLLLLHLAHALRQYQLLYVIYGHLTFLTCLQDFRNYQYTLPVVKGLVVDMEVRKTCIKIPSNRYNEVHED